MTDTDDTDTTDEETSILGAWADDDEGASADDETTPGDRVSERLAGVRERTNAWRVARVAATALAVALVVPFVVYAVPGVVGASHSYVVLSGSMEPTMSPGDVIVVEDVDTATVEEGDVLTFRRDEGARPTTHRVVAVVDRADGDGRAFRTAGDANEAPDRELVTPGDVEGRVMTVAGHPVVFPYVGYVITFAGTQAGFLLLFGAPVALLLGGEIRDLVAAAGTDAAAVDDGDGDGAPAADDGGGGAVGDDGENATASDPDSDDESAATTDADPDDDAAITFTTGELLLGLGALGAFFVYGVWVAYVTLAVWAFAVGGTVGATFLLLGSLYLLGGDGASDDEPDGDAADAEEGPLDALPPVADLFEETGADAEPPSFGAEVAETAAPADDADALSAVDDPLGDWSPPEGWDDDARTPTEIVFDATDERPEEVSHD